MMIEAATEVVPEILKVIAEFSARENSSDVEIAAELSEKVVAIVGPAVAKLTEFEALLLQVAYGEAAFDGLPAETVRRARDEAAAAVFEAAGTEADFWRGLFARVGKIGSAIKNLAN